MRTLERDKLGRARGGIKEMGGLPDALFVIDTNKEASAVDEARRLNIPVIAVVDSNSDPTNIKFPVPGNDDALRAIQLYCELFSGAVLDGLQAEMKAAGVDVGASAQPAAEDVPAGDEAAGEKAAAKKPARNPGAGKPKKKAAEE